MMSSWFAQKLKKSTFTGGVLFILRTNCSTLITCCVCERMLLYYDYLICGHPLIINTNNTKLSCHHHQSANHFCSPGEEEDFLRLFNIFSSMYACMHAFHYLPPARKSWDGKTTAKPASRDRRRSPRSHSSRNSKQKNSRACRSSLTESGWAFSRREVVVVRCARMHACVFSCARGVPANKK